MATVIPATLTHDSLRRSVVLGLWVASAFACTNEGTSTSSASTSSGSSTSSSSSGSSSSSSSGGSSSSSGATSTEPADGGVLPAEAATPPVGPDALARAAGTYAVPADSALPLADGTWVFNTEEGPRLQPATGTAIALGTTLGTVRAAALLPDGLLLATDRALWIADVSDPAAPAVVQSPLSEQIAGARVNLFAAEGPRLWVVETDGLSVLEGGRLFTLSIPGLSFATAQVAWGSAFNNAPALWVRDGNTVWAIQKSDGQVRAWRIRDDLTLTDMLVEGPGAVVLRDDAGEFHVRSASGRWYWYRAPGAFVSASGPGTNSEVLLVGSTQAQVFSEGLFRRLDPWPLPGTLLGHGPDGRVLHRNGNNVTVHALRDGLTLQGLPVGGLITERVTVTVVPDVDTDVVSVRYRVDGAGEVELEEGLRAVELNPNALGVGDHTLDVAVAYADGRLRASTRAALRVEGTTNVTWAADVAPIKQQRCDRCHGTRGNAHLVTTRQQWITEFDDILEAVRTGRMPLNTTPFSSAEVALLLDWQSRNYPE